MSIKFNEVTWYSKLGAIILFILVVPCLTFYIGRQYEATMMVTENVERTGGSPFLANDKPAQTSSAGNPLNLTCSIDNENVTLVNGSSKESIPGSVGSLETHAFGSPVYGDLNGDSQQDAIFFLYQETPGTGVFFYAVAAVNNNGSYVGTNAVFLGDRIAPQNINITNGVAAVNYAVRKDSDPMTESPSVGVTKYLKVKGGELVEEVSK